MKRTIIKATAATALVAGALFATPALATASTYTPPATGTVSVSTIAPGGTVTFSVPAGVFEPGETVTIFLTGENASGASLGFVKFAVQTQSLGTVTSTSTGGLSGANITLPSNASGSYTILATSASNPVGVTASVTASTSTGTSTSDDLATTGLDNAALLPIWLGGGALVLVGGGLAVAASVRRNRKLEDVI